MRTDVPPDPFELAGRGEAGGATFWPDTFFVDMSAYEEDVRAGDGANGEQTSLANAARVHEGAHWIQLAGTTFGRLLAFIKTATGDLAQAMLASAPRRDLERLRDERLDGIAPAARSRGGLLERDRGFSFNTSVLLEHWWAGQAVEHLLLDAGAALPAPRDPALFVGLLLR